MIYNLKLNLKNKKPDIRYLNDMRKVIYDRKWLKTAPNFELYYMYRGLKKKGELRYDITVIPARMLGKEFTKTKGHEHPKNMGEFYITLQGEAIYLAQKRKGKEIKDVFAVKSKKQGDVVIIPPGYAHVTINSSKKDLKIANWVATNCKNKYQTFEKLKGACYFYTKKGWIKNKNYKKVPKLRFEKPKKSIPKNLDFLKG